MKTKLLLIFFLSIVHIHANSKDIYAPIENIFGNKKEAQLKFVYKDQEYQVACGRNYEVPPACWIEDTRGVQVVVCPEDNKNRISELSETILDSYRDSTEVASLNDSSVMNYTSTGIVPEVLKQKGVSLKSYDNDRKQWRLVSGPCDPAVSCNCL